MNEYDDIINMPYIKSRTKPHMKLIDRAAQFSPFAALTTHSDAITETGRLTREPIILDEQSLQLLDSRFHILLERLCEFPTVTFTYFVEDLYKSGGEYVEATGQVRRVDNYEGAVILEDGRKIKMVDVISIVGDIFNTF